ncbi:MAG: hypothetical protein ACRCVG_04160 [Methanobacteriaceae archaeon]
MKKYILLILLILVLTLTISSVSANEVTINDTNSAGIKGAIENGNSIIILESGVYNGEKNTKISVFPSKNITIKSKNPNNKAIIDCENVSWFIENGENLTLENIIIKNGQGYGQGFKNTTDTKGVITNLGILNITNCSFVNSSISKGNLIINGKNGVGGGILNIVNSSFINNTFVYDNYWDSGPIYNNGTMIIKNSNFINNTAYDGGAIYNNGNMAIYSSSFINNKALGNSGTGIGSGGAIYNYDTQYTLIIYNSTFINNSGDEGAAIYTNGGITISYSKFMNNTSNMSGTIISYGGEDSKLVIYESVFTNNQAERGGAILNFGNLIVVNCNFTNNKANLGGAIYNFYSMNVSKSTFKSNSALNGSDIYLNIILQPVSINYNTFLDSKGYSIYYNNTITILNITIKGNVSNIAISHNLFGTNNIKSKVFGVNPINYYIIKISTIIANKKLSPSDNLLINYYIVLNGTHTTKDTYNFKYFTTSLYCNNKLLKNIDGRFNSNQYIPLTAIINYIKVKIDGQEYTIKYTARKLKTLSIFVVALKSKKYVTFKYTLKDAKNKKLGSKWVKFYKGKTYIGKAKTNTKGIAYIKLKTSKIKGKNKITAKYIGTGIYNSTQTAKTIKI